MNELNKHSCRSESEKESKHVCTNFHNAIEFIGKRWMGAVIYALMTGPKRYHEIISLIPAISDRLLTERLRDLESEGLITKKVIATSPKRVEYELTAAGKNLEEVINTLVKWTKNRSNT
ncbi:winged helix-turn-helix transcriptional regulator [Neobacillus cucumis]|uniref:winged helix-turn-helix transcriptional regulator n=1 Tax=Neobacillus cucumis TaxID=1740721 RepID=UPI0019646703|nr:helix-turn-helix domain-containing protein [Neobacillus cucumis]MBM7655029.1 DNA-binding HxlR family transcriptional regulator [Neobacillus cucumis]